MYNKFDWCECDRVDGTEDIKKGICKIKEGIECIKEGLKKLCRCRVREGIKDIQKGLCKIEKGLCDVVKGLQNLDDGCSEGKKTIKEGICDIKEGIKCVEKGLCEACKCEICKAVETICKGLHMIEKGLCKLVEGLKDILNDRDIKRKHECDVMGEMSCENKMCGGCEEMDPCKPRGDMDFSEFQFERPTWRW